MELSSSLASQSYQMALNAAKPSPSEGGDKAADMLGSFAREFMDTVTRGEEVAKDGLVGKADPHSVVEALAATELAVETAVSVRDKVVEAYQEILRMPV